MEYIAGNRYVLPSRSHKFIAHSLTKAGHILLRKESRGECLAYSWKSRSAESQTRILQQCKQMIDGMRSITSPSSAIANVDGGRLWECRLHVPGRSLSFGLFDNIDNFHQYLRGGIQSQSSEHPSAINELIELHSREWPAPVSTSGSIIHAQGIEDGEATPDLFRRLEAGCLGRAYSYRNIHSLRSDALVQSTLYYLAPICPYPFHPLQAA